ncbi:MAG: DUF2723 domain-containing protein [bacterium]
MGKKDRKQKTESRREKTGSSRQKQRKGKVSFRIPKFLIPRDEPIVPMSFSQIDYAGGMLVFFICWAVYLHTLTPTIGFHDSGDMVTAAFVLGIPHPTGYPLYCLLGKLWMTILPIGNIAYRMNLASALCASLACVMVYFIILKVGDRKWEVRSEENKLISHLLSLIPAIVGALMLAFATTFWEQAVIAEKYTLNALFATLLIFILLKWQEAMAEVKEQSTEDRRQKVKGKKQRAETSYQLPNYPITQLPNKLLYLFAFTLGLSFTHHMQTIYLVPASIFFIVAVYWKKCRQQKQSFYSLLSTLYPLLLKLLCLFILPLFLYLYLPIRASQHPPLNWWNPETFERFIIHISGELYKDYFVSNLNEIYKNLSDIPNFLIDQFTQYFWWISLIGFFILLLQRKIIFIFFFLMIIVNVFFAIRYSIPNIEDYYILSYVIFSILFSLCIGFIINRILQNNKKILLFSILFFIFPIIVFFIHYSYNNRNDYYYAYDYGWNILSPLNKKTVVFMEGDAITFNTFYLHLCEEYSSETALVFINFLAAEWYFKSCNGESWYSKMIKSRYNIELTTSIPYSKVNLEDIPKSVLRTNVNEIMCKNRLKKTISVFISDGEEISKNYILIPNGSLNEVVNKDIDTKELYIKLNKSTKKFFRKRNVLDNNKVFKDPKWTLEVIINYMLLYNRRGMLYFNMGKYKDAIIEYKKVLEIKINLDKFPYFIPYGNQYNNLLDKYKELKEEAIKRLVLSYYYRGREFHEKKFYLKAIKVYKKAIELQPKNISIRNIIGYLYFSLGKYEEAIAEFKKAIEINSTDIKSHINLANVYYKKGLFEEVIKECSHILKLDSNNTYALQMQRVILSKKEGNDE